MTKLCKYCNTENRACAKYCKSCGKLIAAESQSSLMNLVDRDELKEEIKALCTSLKNYKNSWNSSKTFRTHMIISGNSGTGKTTIANLITEELFNEAIIKKEKPITVDSAIFDNKLDELEQLFVNAKGGVLFIDNVHKFIPNPSSKNLNHFDRLVNQIDANGHDPIVILAGIKDTFDEYLSQAPAIANRFEYYFRLRDYLPSELYTIAKNKLEEYGLTLNDKSAEKLLMLFKYELKKGKSNYTNGHFAINIAEDIARNYYNNHTAESNSQTINSSDIDGNYPKPKSLNEIFAELDELIGLEKVKAALREIAAYVQLKQKKDLKEKSNSTSIGFHLVLTGNPGTGKTMIARKLGEVLEAIGYLERGHVVEVDKSGLVGQYLGETPQKVQKKCDQAMGGVLFIDEAYSLAKQPGSGSSNSYGQEAIDTLLKRMEDERDKFVVVAAGYRNEMQRFINSNTGLESRFDRYIHIDDYTQDELFRIFHFFLKKNRFIIQPDADEKVNELIKDMYDNRDDNFANAREVRKLFERITLNLSKRIMKDPTKQNNLIVLDDIPFEKDTSENLEDILKNLNELIGLQSIKDEVNKLASLLKAEKKRKEILGESIKLDYHFVFMGNPGTGKTTVARLLGKIFKSLGLLSSGHTVEVTRSDLVASHVGQTSEKTNSVIDTAMGGVLFIDEAYSLVVKDSSNDFGKQAVQTILKRMEDDLGKFVLIVAGYPNEMLDFLHSNPGLESRFRKKIRFPDYDSEELFSIFKLMARNKKLTLSKEAEVIIKTKLHEICKTKTHNFGNARTVRNMFNDILENQSFRIAKLMDDPNFENEKLFIIEEEDIK